MMVYRQTILLSSAREKGNDNIDDDHENDDGNKNNDSGADGMQLLRL